MQIPQLTFLRFLAALGVVFFHFGQSTWPWNTSLLLPAIQQAGLGVGFFFTLSGFLMAWVYSPQPRLDIRKYAQTRFARIYPLYLLCFLLALGAELLIRGTRPRGLSIILQALGLHAWVPGYSLTMNFPGWSVSVELFFYALFPLLLFRLRGRHWAVTMGFAALLSILCLYISIHIAGWTQGFIVDPNHDLTLRFPLWQVHTFVTGMVCGLLYREGKLRLPSHWLQGLLFGVAAAGMVSLAYFENVVIKHSGTGLLAPVFVLMIICLAQDRGWLARAFSWKPMVFLGEMSYAIYLLQAPVYISMEPFAEGVGKGLHGVWFHVYVGVLLAISAVVYQWFERPMRQWLRPKVQVQR